MTVPAPSPRKARNLLAGWYMIILCEPWDVPGST
jgi:hypothetical protein